jgi:hypothetical protein
MGATAISCSLALGLGEVAKRAPVSASVAAGAPLRSTPTLNPSTSACVKCAKSSDAEGRRHVARTTRRSHDVAMHNSAVTRVRCRHAFMHA